MPRSISKWFLAGIAFCVMLPLAATDAEAEAKYDAGRKLYLKNDYREAAKCFSDSYILAESSAIRANSLLAQIGAYRMCGLYYEEFKAIELLLDKYAEFGNYQELVDREFEIGEAFHRGRRDPAFWALRWAVSPSSGLPTALRPSWLPFSAQHWRPCHAARLWKHAD